MRLENHFTIYTGGMNDEQVKQLAGKTGKAMLFAMFQKSYRRVIDKSNLTYVFHHIGYQKITHNKRHATRVSIVADVFETIVK